MISEELKRRAQKALDAAEQLTREDPDAIRSSVDMGEILDGEVTPTKKDAASPAVEVQ